MSKSKVNVQKKYNPIKVNKCILGNKQLQPYFTMISEVNTGEIKLILK